MQKRFKAEVVKQWIQRLSQEMADLEDQVRQMGHLHHSRLFARAWELETRSNEIRAELHRLQLILATMPDENEK